METWNKKRRQPRLINGENTDRGKRHFWGHLRGDYGFYKSNDLDDLIKVKQQTLNLSQRRQYSSLNKISQIQQPEEHEIQDSKINRFQRQKLESASKNRKSKNILRITNSFQLQLPPINRAKHVQFEQEEMKHFQKIKYQDARVNRNATIDASTMDSMNYESTPLNLRHNNEDRQRTMEDEQYGRIQRQRGKGRTIKTELSQYYNDLRDNRPHRIRYTPTYICSLSNPMPTFKFISAPLKNHS